MEHTVEDIRGRLQEVFQEYSEDLDIFGLPMYNPDLEDGICNLFSTILDGLKKPERRANDNELFKHGYNLACEELNAKISTIQKALKEETK